MGALVLRTPAVEPLFPTPTSGLLIPLANNIDSDQKLEWSVLVLIPSLPRGLELDGYVTLQAPS